MAPLSEEERTQVLAVNEEFASRGLRVLAIAYRPVEGPAPEEDELERDLIFLGLTAIQDPPRPEARRAVTLCHEAGIQPVMITGDHAATALAIARDLNIVGAEGSALTGAEIARLSRRLDLVGDEAPERPAPPPAATPEKAAAPLASTPRPAPPKPPAPPARPEAPPSAGATPTPTPAADRPARTPLVRPPRPPDSASTAAPR